MPPSEKPKVFSLRLPPELYAEVQAMADAECRSMNDQIVYAIRRLLAAYQDQGPTQIRRD